MSSNQTRDKCAVFWSRCVADDVDISFQVFRVFFVFPIHSCVHPLWQISSRWERTAGDLQKCGWMNTRKSFTKPTRTQQYVNRNSNSCLYCEVAGIRLNTIILTSTSGEAVWISLQKCTRRDFVQWSNYDELWYWYMQHCYNESLLWMLVASW